MLPESGRLTFRKKERLCSKNTFSYLFANGSSLRAGALSVYYSFDVPDELIKSPVTVAFAVPKRHIKEAVNRNYVKRRMREVFRHKKSEIIEVLSSRQSNLILLISYNRPKLASFDELHYKMEKLLNKVLKKIEAREN
ncbi:MAG: ribonuclease P protein component [Bacteroidota bacterium]